MNKFSRYAPHVLRIGMSLVFIWFGMSQLMNPTDWVGFVPDSIATMFSMSAGTIVHINGIFEVVFGAALLLGLFTRVTAFLLALHMLDITMMVGFDALGVRDFGLSVATIVIWMMGADTWTLDHYIEPIKNAESGELLR